MTFKTVMLDTLRVIIPTVIAVALTSVMSSARAAPMVHGSVTATASVSVNVVAPQTISSGQSLTLRSVIRPANGRVNTVTVDPNGKMSVAGAGDAALTGDHPAVSGVFQIVGEPNTAYSLTQSLRFDQPGLRDVTAILGAPSSGVAGLLPASGQQEVRYGGAFKIDAATPAGRYTGALQVMANYN
jgi:Domain of unknown function (DUF4402)